MKKVIIVSLLVLSPYVGFSQNSQKISVEKSTFGIQTGLLGLWVHNELKLSNQVALRSEIGLGGVNSGDIKPLIALGSRWYYNLKKRAEKDKRIDGNSGNYISIRASYRFNTTLEGEMTKLNQLLLTPTLGIRRNIGNHFNYEAGLGFGLKYQRRIFLPAGYFHLRIGYRF